MQLHSLARKTPIALMLGMAFGAVQAQAQSQEVAPELARVEVTGSRIPSINTDGASPITAVTARDIKVDGVRSAEEILNLLPQVTASQGGAVSDGATGTSTVSLRGLGADRTLVLMNGKRLPAGSVASSAADLTQIPTSLIKRVDVLTGGAGAVYGAGAVAGVVNFIMKDNFSGVEVQVNQSGYQHKQGNAVSAVSKARGFAQPDDSNFDGKVRDVNVLMGGNFDGGKGNATVYFSYKQTDALLLGQRDYAACALGSSATGFSCSGSSTNAGGRVTANGTSYMAVDAAGTVRPYASTDAYNYGPLNYLQRPTKTYGFNAQAHYDINENVRLYNEFNFHSNTTDAQVAPGGIFYGVQTALSYDNPLLSSSWKTALGLTPTSGPVTVTLGKRNVEGGTRIRSITDTSFRELVGAKGDVGAWNYDVFAQFARVNHSEYGTGYFSRAKILKALDVVPDANGNAVCRSFANGTDTKCVPYNLYATGGVTQAALDYLTIAGQNSGYTQQIVYGGSVGADLAAYGVTSPWARHGVGVSFGAERRSEKLVYLPDEATRTDDLSGGTGASPSLTGTYSVKEIFGEVKVPLVEKKPWIESLEVQASYRYSDYSTGKGTDTYGAGFDWAPVKKLRLRGSYQRAVRAPTIQDLYAAQSVGSGGPTNDPCAGTSPTATAAQCANTGVTAAQYGTIERNSANEYKALNGGNPDLSPEVADTYTLGIVLEPMRNLTLTVDAFKIDIANTISSVDPTTALNQCLTTGNAAFCSLIHRNSNGSLWLTSDGYVSHTTTNIGSVGTSGVDIGGSYRLPLAAYGGLGGLDFTLNGTWLRSLTTENVPGKGEYDCKGLFGATCGVSNPEWRHKFRVLWSTPWNVDLAATWRHFNAVDNDKTSSNTLLAGTVNPVEAKLGARDYLDLNAAWAVNKMFTVSGGISNLFDRDPPIASTNATGTNAYVNGNTYPMVYDAYGRKLYLNLTAKF
jgi:outer membrane receptor protein involved in Fe transport